MYVYCPPALELQAENYYWWCLCPPQPMTLEASSVVASFFFFLSSLFYNPLYMILVECPPWLLQCFYRTRIRHLHTFSDTVGAQLPDGNRHPCMRTNRASRSVARVPGVRQLKSWRPQVYSRGNLAIQPASNRDPESDV